PIGVPGELHVGGAGLARGYLRRPDSTAERFIANPFDDDPRERLYRTGDRCRWRADGNLEFLGRFDEQIKLRGFRIEPGEIEAALHGHPSVTQCVVAIREDRPGEKRLVAYCVPTADVPWNPTGLSLYLRDRLPRYMIPTAFVPLRALPLTATGKLDRRALPRPEVTDLRGAGEGYLAPRDDLERRLVAVWEEVFDVRPIGVRDDFFDLGGYSLLAVQLFARMEKAVGTHLPLSTLLRRSTIEALADVYRNGRDDQADDEARLVPIRPDGRTPPLYLVPGGRAQGLAPGISVADLCRAAGPDLTVYSLLLPRIPEGLPLNRLVRDIAEQFVKEIRAFQSSGPYHLGGHSFGGLIAFEMACLLSDQGEPVNLLAVLDTSAPGFQTRLTWSGRLRYHWRKLRNLSVRSGLAHLGKSFRTSVRNRIRPRRLKRAGDAYREKPRRFSGRVTLFRAAENAEAIPRTEYDLSRGWNAVATQGAEVFEIRGDHVTMLQEPGLSEIAAVLRERLGARERSGNP
ncbi:MAG: alpha/beta fold hydrolase, partial [Isosphaeraceae bacterium]